MSNTDTQKSPLHPHALTAEDLVPGRRIITFNISQGELGEYEVISAPHLVQEEWHSEPSHKVMLRSIDGGFEWDHYLADMGVVPGETSQPDGWNDRNFTIDASMRDTLPEIDEVLAEQDRTSFMDLDDDLYDWDDDCDSYCTPSRGDLFSF